MKNAHLGILQFHDVHRLFMLLMLLCFEFHLELQSCRSLACNIEVQRS